MSQALSELPTTFRNFAEQLEPYAPAAAVAWPE